jgi:hypothetical protein
MPLRVVEVEGQRGAMVKGELDGQSPLLNLAVPVPQLAQRGDLQGGVRERRVVEKDDLVVLLVRVPT